MQVLNVNENLIFMKKNFERKKEHIIVDKVTIVFYFCIINIDLFYLSFYLFL